ncbi:hypothetical protein [Paenibacillus solani]|uniref:hypothetical protein n=1 Tax=Paenibacillus solani TaxID=1705565 RepID=UPI003D268487
MAIKGQKSKRNAKKVFGNLDAGGKKERYKLIEKAADLGQVTEFSQLLYVSRSDI